MIILDIILVILILVIVMNVIINLFLVTFAKQIIIFFQMIGQDVEMI